MTKRIRAKATAAIQRPETIHEHARLEREELLPVVPLKDLVVFPQCVSPLYVVRPKSVASVEEALGTDKRVFLVAQKQVDIENPTPEDLYAVGTIGEILQTMRMNDGSLKVLIEGQIAARIVGFEHAERTVRAMVSPLEIATESSKEIAALTRLVLDQFETYVSLSDKIPDDLFLTIRNFSDPIQIANTIAHYANFKTPEKQEVLEATQVRQKLETLSRILTAENELLELEEKILQQVKSRIGKSQKEFFLNEQLKAIERELGLDRDDDDYEIDELGERLARTKLSREARDKAQRELARMTKMPPMSPEASVSRSYIEWLVDLPWGKFTKDKTDLAKAQQVLDSEHYGLTKVKDRILEFLAVHQLTKHVKGPILCLVGPPGVGKTSLARSVARALGRRFVRMSLGGVRDEAEIRGHRRTYVGSLPGRIIQGMKKAGSMNPVFLLDEIDKMSSDFRGDPASALLEVLDPEQNKAFNDHYLEVDFDLSHVLFITTANTVAGIPAPLLDRMEVIRLPGYTEEEKLHIAEQFLVPKQLKASGLSRRRVEFTREAIQTLIVHYTREAGVRNLEREIAAVCRRLAREIVTQRQRSGRLVVTPERVREYLGPLRYRDLEIEKKPEIGVATGLAWTEVGGEILPTEVTVMRGRGQLLLTGQLGEVMQESAKTALSYIRSRMDELRIPRDFYRKLDIHVHIPEGAVPKDGPSAGVTLTTSMVSALTKRPVRQDVAMTGEITLRGKVLKIGGLKEKILAAHRARIRHIIIPQDNADELEEIPADIRKEMNFTLVETVDEVLETALVNPPTRGN